MTDSSQYKLHTKHPMEKNILTFRFVLDQYLSDTRADTRAV